MNKKDLRNIKWMVEDIRCRMWRIECLGHIVESVINDDEIIKKYEFGTLTVILNEAIYRSKKVISRLEHYLMQVNAKY